MQADVLLTVMHKFLDVQIVRPVVSPHFTTIGNGLADRRFFEMSWLRIGSDIAHVLTLLKGRDTPCCKNVMSPKNLESVALARSS